MFQMVARKRNGDFSHFSCSEPWFISIRFAAGPCGQGRHCGQLCFNLPCSQGWQIRQKPRAESNFRSGNWDQLIERCFEVNQGFQKNGGAKGSIIPPLPKMRSGLSGGKTGFSSRGTLFVLGERTPGASARKSQLCSAAVEKKTYSRRSSIPPHHRGLVWALVDLGLSPNRAPSELTAFLKSASKQTSRFVDIQ